MRRNFEKEKQIITFEKINTFEEMLNIPTKDICFTQNDGFGLVIQDVGFIRKKYTLIHKHPYYKIDDCALCNNQVNRETFNSCGYTFFERKVRFKYNNKLYKNWIEYVEDIYFNKEVENEL